MRPVSAVLALCIIGIVAAFPVVAQESTGTPDGNGADAGNPGSPIVPAEDLDITTASDFFDEVSERYSEIEDYQSHITITQDDSVMYGLVSHKRPDMLLIEFESPRDAVLSVDGVHLQLYFPFYNVVLDQPLKPHGTNGLDLALTATNQGLQLFRNKYSIAYLDSQNYVRLDEDSDEFVRKLKLEWKDITEGFRELTLSIDDDLLIRRIDGVTAGLSELRIDFTDTVVNPGLPNQMFVWDSPPTAYVIRNFIFDPSPEPEEE